ncbi:VgrG protein [Helicobacter sp. MIT 05-5294]|nr:VgrG protein [Helicobacter sp. MIT 05-5294]
MPRVGDEVIISFLDDDIDKPYVSGSLYNQSNPALPNLPLDFHQTSFSARTLNQEDNAIEEGINQITLSSLKNQEQIYLQAQKDYQELIKHNFTQRIENNKDSKVEGIYQERIKKAHFQTIDLAKNVNIGGEYLTNVALSKDTNVGLSNTLNVGANNTTRIAKDSSEYVGNDKKVEIKGKSAQCHQGNFDIFGSASGNIHTEQGLNLSSKGEVSLASSNVLNISTKQSMGILANKMLVIEAQNIAHQSLEKFLIQAQNGIAIASPKDFKTTLGDKTEIYADDKQITLKVGENEIKINAEGICIKGKVRIE